MNKLFDRFSLYVSYDEIVINHLNRDLSLGGFKTVDESIQAIDELIAIIKNPVLVEDYMSLSVSSTPPLQCYSVDANIALHKSNKIILYKTFTTNTSDLDHIKELALNLLNVKLIDAINKDIGGSDRIIHNLTAIKTTLQLTQNQFDVIDIIKCMPKAKLESLLKSNKLVSELEYISTKDRYTLGE